MKKYKYRIIMKKENTYYTIQKKELSLCSQWEYESIGDTIEECELKISCCVKDDAKPEFEIIKEINPYA